MRTAPIDITARQQSFITALEAIQAAFMDAYIASQESGGALSIPELASLRELAHTMKERGQQLENVATFWEKQTLPHHPPSRFPYYGPSTIILIAAPSGAGKTSFSQKLMDNALPHIARELDIDVNAIRRFDLKGRIPHHVMENNMVLLLECCIDRFATRASPLKAFNLLMPLLAGADHLIIITLKADKKEIARRYFNRILRNARRRQHNMMSLWGLLHYRKYLTAIKYRYTDIIPKAYMAWHASSSALQHPHLKSFRHICINCDKDGNYHL